MRIFCALLLAAGCDTQLIIGTQRGTAGGGSAGGGSAGGGSAGGGSAGGAAGGSELDAGAARLFMTPAFFAFNSVDAGFSSAPYGFTLQNTGTDPTGAVSVSVPAPFLITSSDCGNPLAANGSCTFDVSFRPLTFGAFDASVQATSGALATTSRVTGTGRDEVTLSLTKTGACTGVVSGNFINCGVPCAMQTAVVPRTTAVPNITLTATPTQNCAFNGFSGVSCAGNPCTFPLSGSTSVAASFTPLQLDVTVRKVYRGSASGSVVSSDGGMRCDEACTSATQRVDYNSSLTLTALPDSGFIGFEGWDGGQSIACTSSTTCSLSLIRSNLEVVAYFSPYNLAFVTDLLVAPGALGGVDGGDALCSSFAPGGANAQGTKLPAGTTYRALLLPVGGDITTRLTNTSVAPSFVARGWVRPDGLPFLDRATDTYGVRYPLRVTATGVDLDGGFETGTNSSLGGAAWGGDCNGYSLTSGNTWAGNASYGGGAFLFTGQPADCAVPHRLFCLGIDYAVPLRYERASGRNAFMSHLIWRPGLTINGFTGRDSADQHCRTEASDAGLPNAASYLAVLATTTQSAAARFDLEKAPWVRSGDGVRVAPTAAAFFDLGQLLEAPLNVGARGLTYPTYLTWTGSTTPYDAGSPTETCFDWSVQNGNAPVTGLSGATTAERWQFLSSPQCSLSAGRLYCLQP